METGGVSISIRSDPQVRSQHPSSKNTTAANIDSNRTPDLVASRAALSEHLPNSQTTSSSPIGKKELSTPLGSPPRVRRKAGPSSPGKQETTPLGQWRPPKKIIECQSCQRQFVNKSALRMHASQKHPQTAARPPQLKPASPTLPASVSPLVPGAGDIKHRCVACNMDFGDQKSLEMHNKTRRHRSASNPKDIYNSNGLPISRGFPDSSYQQEAEDVKTSKPHVPSLDQSISSAAATGPPRRLPFRPVSENPQPSAEPQQIGVLAKAVVQQEPDPPEWSELSPDQQSIAHNVLLQYCVPVEKLPKSYLSREATEEDINGYRRCKNCKGLQKDIIQSKKLCIYHPLKPPEKPKSKKNKQEKSNVLSYACCGERGRGCVTTSQHSYGLPDPIVATRLREYRATPGPTAIPNPRRRFAVALDCEMVGVKSGQDIISLGAVDYLTGEVLIDKLVNPSQPVTSWRSQITGINRAKLQEAVAQGAALAGKIGARAELWKYIDSETILIGHCLHYDLDVLGMVHPRIVDSEIIVKAAVGSSKRSWGLKTLAKAFLDMTIQTKKSPHNSLEDALATREVVLWCTRNPMELMEWATQQRREMEEEREAREKAKEEKKKLEEEKAAAAAAAAIASASAERNRIASSAVLVLSPDDYEDDDYYEIGSDGLPN